jgi:hypothetical protein
MNNGLQTFDNTVNGWLSYVDSNEYVSSALAVFLILYAGFAAPKLPEYIARLFESSIFKFLIIFLIAYSARSNPTIALIAAIGLIVSLQTLNRYDMNRAIVMSAVHQEAFQEAHAQRQYMAHEPEGHMEMIEETAATEEHIPEEVLSELTDAPPACSKTMQYRNAFYPQYVNMKPDAYMARYTGNDVNGYDPNANYSNQGRGL